MTNYDYIEPSQHSIVPHARTLRNAREQIKQMVATGVSLHLIKRYLLNWVGWWTLTAEYWSKHEILNWFLEACWDPKIKDIVGGLINPKSPQSQTSKWYNSSVHLARA